jgi:hypothetical protein
MNNTTINSITNAALRCSRTKDAIVAYAETADLPAWSHCFLTAQVHTITGALLVITQLNIRSHEDAEEAVAYLDRVNQGARDSLASAKQRPPRV